MKSVRTESIELYSIIHDTTLFIFVGNNAVCCSLCRFCTPSATATRCSAEMNPGCRPASVQVSGQQRGQRGNKLNQVFGLLETAPGSTWPLKNTFLWTQMLCWRNCQFAFVFPCVLHPVRAERSPTTAAKASGQWKRCPLFMCTAKHRESLNCQFPHKGVPQSHYKLTVYYLMHRILNE